MKILKKKAKWKVRVLKVFHAQLHSKLNYLRCMIKIKHSLHSYSIFDFVFKPKQNEIGMMKNINKLALLLKFIQIRRCQSDCDHAKVHRGQLITAIFVHRNESSIEITSTALRCERLRACSDILSDAWIGRPYETQQPSFTVLLSRAIFM